MTQYMKIGGFINSRLKLNDLNLIAIIVGNREQATKKTISMISNNDHFPNIT